MALDNTPWFVGGGAQHSPEIARLLAYATTSGAEGIVSPTDMRVQPLDVPGTSVRALSGAALVLNRYAGGLQQTYAVRNISQTTVPVSPTGSAGGRSDLVVVRVLDPQFEGDAPSDPIAFQYSRLEVIQGVPSNTRSARELNLNYPALALARIDLPASTATVTNTMITDLRKVALPRKERFLLTHALTQGQEETLTTTDPTGEMWPNAVNWRVDVPEWATRAHIVGTYAQVTANASSNNYGRLMARLGAWSDQHGIETQHVSYDVPEGTGHIRGTWIVAAPVNVPEGLRGRTIPVYLKGYVRGGANSARPVLDSVSAVTFDIEFHETAV